MLLTNYSIHTQKMKCKSELIKNFPNRIHMKRVREWSTEIENLDEM